MYSCAVFGYKDFNYEAYESDIKGILVDLIENRNVTYFFSGGRGKFDMTCAKIINQLKKDYPYIVCTQVLSYRPTEKIEISTFFDGTVYLLDRFVPQKYAIVETNKTLVEKVEFVVSGVKNVYGGAFTAVEYSKKKNKKIISLF